MELAGYDAGLARRHLMGESIGAMLGIAPDLAGLGTRCLPSPGPRFPTSTAWLSANPEIREAARHACQSCPALASCRTWALSLPQDGARDRDGPIVAGWTAPSSRPPAAQRGAPRGPDP